MKKRIAVLVGERQGEALRMSLGLLLGDDVVDVYVIDKKLQPTADRDLHLETMREMEMKLFTNCRENADMEYLTTAEIARRLPSYDTVLPY